MSVDRLSEIIQEKQDNQKQELSKTEAQLLKALRFCEQICEIDNKYGVLDFSIKAKSRTPHDIDIAYWQSRNELAVWSNIKIGNSLLLEYEIDEDARLCNVSLLR